MDGPCYGCQLALLGYIVYIPAMSCLYCQWQCLQLSCSCTSLKLNDDKSLAQVAISLSRCADAEASTDTHAPMITKCWLSHCGWQSLAVTAGIHSIMLPSQAFTGQ
jgi:hypothetical protein